MGSWALSSGTLPPLEPSGDDDPDIFYERANNPRPPPPRRNPVESHVSTLNFLSRCSRRHNRRVTPGLYSSVRPHSTASLLAFLRTVAKQSELAGMVRKFELEGLALIRPDLPYEVALVRHVLRLLRGRVHRLWMIPSRDEPYSKDARFFDTLKNSLRHAFLVDHVINLLPNLDHITLPVSRFTQYGRFLLDKPPLWRLRTMAITSDPEDAGWSLGSVAIIINKAPGLYSIGTNRCCHIPATINYINIRCVNMLNALLDSNSIYNLAATAKGLHHFAIQFYQGLSSNIGACERRPLTPRQIVQALAPCQDTLGFLEIQVGNYFGRNGFQQCDTIPDLHDFIRLHTIVLDERCFFNGRRATSTVGDLIVPRLPPTIEKVILRRITSEAWPDVLELLHESCQGSFLSLNRIVIEFRYDTVLLIPDETSLFKMLDEMGVQVTFARGRAFTNTQVLGNPSYSKERFDPSLMAPATPDLASLLAR